MPRSFKACLGSCCPARRAMRHHLDEKRIPDFARSKLSARDKLGRGRGASRHRGALHRCQFLSE
eukprot:3526701-Alexandrium_andersonii.AAC.1